MSSSVETLAHTGAKRVTLRGVTSPPNLADIRNVTVSEDSISFLYGGAPGELTGYFGIECGYYYNRAVKRRLSRMWNSVLDDSHNMRVC